MLPLAILAGGYATRLGSLTHDVPKCLIKINGRAFVDWQLDLLIASGFRDFIFCISYKSNLVQNYLGDGSSRGVQIRYSLDGAIQLGTGGAVQNALPLLGSQFGIIYGDSYLPIDYSKVEEKFLSSSGLAMMTVYENCNAFDASNVEYSDGILIDYKKGTSNPKMHHIDYGLTYFRSDAFAPIDKITPFDLSVKCQQLVRAGKLDGFEVFERFYEIGSLNGIDELTEYLRKESK
jgi:MurNAc alpha-1-phosphate uridylyltransferase